jgi:glycine/serine hydroxymethyltransferase
MCHITLNKSAIFGDNGSISPGGVRIGEQSCYTALASRLKKMSRRFVPRPVIYHVQSYPPLF